MALSPRFETLLDHTVYDGESMIVPLLVDLEFGLTEDSQALLHAANIVGSTILREETDVETMFDRIAKRLDDAEGRGVIVEDSHSKGSLNISPDSTTVKVREVGTWELPTGLLFDMAYAWSELSEKDF